MPDATLGRKPTAHTTAELSNGSPTATLSRDMTGRVEARLEINAPGTEDMAIDSAYIGEDIPITAVYDGGGTDPDDTGSDGTPDATITILDNDDGTEVISAATMTHESTGIFEYGWATGSDANGSGIYIVEVTADFSSETKIVKDSIELED